MNERYDKLFDVLITHDRLTNEQLVELRTQQMALDGKLAGVQAEMRQGFKEVHVRFEEQDKWSARLETTLNEHSSLLTQILARLPEKP